MTKIEGTLKCELHLSNNGKTFQVTGGGQPTWLAYTLFQAMTPCPWLYDVLVMAMELHDDPEKLKEAQACIRAFEDRAILMSSAN
jgi:hypothetical protein